MMSRSRVQRRAGTVAIGIGVLLVALAGAFLGGAFGSSQAVGPASSPAFVGSGAPSESAGASQSPDDSSSPAASAAPTPVLVAAPLDGVPVSPSLAGQHVIAVMIDDLSPARPQSGISDASVVWQAPAEGGIPRYMLLFQERTPRAVGPVRSARYYYIAWASEWKAAYVHAGGSPQALDTLRAQGSGQLVYNADQFAWGSYFWRVTTRFPPHNLYTDGKHLRELSRRLGATAPPAKAVWRFGPDAPLEQRPQGGQIEVDYLANRIVYRYDRATNTYRRFVTGSTKQQVDAGTKQLVAPKNVVIMRMVFGALNDGHPNKHRLEARITGSGVAWIATNGHTMKGTWRKRSVSSPTRFYDAGGHQVRLTVGQTFVQVMKTTDIVKIQDGKIPPPSVPSLSPGTSPSASPSARIGSVWAAI
jgi:Protein of unknown function (DUF3048) N-terminal domain/Protein of unknown function (DUF3048) C-terminal domain